MGSATQAPGTQSSTADTLSQPAHALSWQNVADELHTDVEQGLDTDNASKRLQQNGRNELGGGGGPNAGKVLIRQVANAMTLVLILAMAVSFGIGSYIEGAVVALVILINIVVGFFQEYKAAKTMDSLRSLSSPTAMAVRNGERVSIPTIEVVVGDVIELKTGDTVPADLRLVEAVNFEADEALLTGESLPVRKSADSTFDAATGPGDRLNVAYSSTTVTKGRATGLVFATGLQTEIGSIAAALRGNSSRVRSVKREADGTAKPHRYAQAAALTVKDAVGTFLGVNVGTPLQRKLSQLAILLFFVAVVFAIIVLAANGFRALQEVIIYAVATGLSMIPASLVVVLTITMAAGTKRMVERHVIVRNLSSLEALGGVTDICSDKTGTLTQGKMVAKKAWVPAAGTFTVGETDEPFNPTKGVVSYTASVEPRDAQDEEVVEEKVFIEMHREHQSLDDYLRVASLANLAHINQSDDGTWTARGDPTEIAIKVFALRFDAAARHNSVAARQSPMKLLQEFPFDSDIKRMSVIYQNADTEQRYVFTKGAVERVLASCTQYVADDSAGPVDVTQDFRDRVLENMEGLAALGLRVLALASRDYSEPHDAAAELDRSIVESKLIFRGLIGLYDPPRAESAPSVRQCHEAGIEVHMLTGDHPGTARAIAAQVGILPANMSEWGKDVADAMVMTAAQFDALSDEEIDALPVLPLVVARCAPNTKVRMIDALHRRGKFCAMTGDGVNDSPALKRADVGVAMGQAGSDVAKDASDIILTDDNFASILAAVEEGRRTFDNIQKFCLHLLAQNAAQALILLIGLAFKDGENISVFPIAPVEIMWIIMITSSFPDMGLGFEPAAPGIMRRPPHNLKRGVFTPEILLDMLFYGVWIAALCLAAFALVLYVFEDGAIGLRCNESIGDGCDVVFRARATCFATLTWLSVFLAWEVKQPWLKREPLVWVRSLYNNHFLFWAVAAGFVTIFPVLYIPGLNTIVFLHTGISWEWAIVFIATLLFFAGSEGWKVAKTLYMRRREGSKGQRPSAVNGGHALTGHLTESSLGSVGEKV